MVSEKIHWYDKKIIEPCINLLYGFMIGFSFYLFSYHSDMLPWGKDNRDGLELLFYFYFLLPTMIVLALAKIYYGAKHKFITYSIFNHYSAFIFCAGF
jgi:hypothetical protein